MGRLGLFDEEPDGYLRFRQTLLRDAAYEGLPFKLRRNSTARSRRISRRRWIIPEEAGGILSLHYFEAGDYQPAWQYATAAAKRAEGVYAYVEAAGLYARALEAGSKLPDLPKATSGTCRRRSATRGIKAGEFRKALDAYTAAQAAGRWQIRLARPNCCSSSRRSRRSSASIRRRCAGSSAPARRSRVCRDRSRPAERARPSAWYATVLQAQGRTEDALKWAERGAREAEEADDPEARSATPTW